jgi:hypothetical protein
MSRLIPLLIVTLLLSAEVNVWGMNVDLRFVPTKSSTPGQSLLAAVKSLRPVKVLAFTDNRRAGENILGEFNVNGQMEKVQSNIPLAEYAGESFKQVYEEWGGQIAPDARLALKGEITQFAFEEAEGFQARIGIHFYLADDSNRVIWDGHSSGVIRGGRAVTPKTLSGILSDVLLATYAELFEDEKLVGVWSGRVSSTYVIKDDAVVESGAARTK